MGVTGGVFTSSYVFIACHRKANLKVPLQRPRTETNVWTLKISWLQVYRLGVQEFRIVFHRTFFDMEREQDKNASSVVLCTVEPLYSGHAL